MNGFLDLASTFTHSNLGLIGSNLVTEAVPTYERFVGKCQGGESQGKLSIRGLRCLAGGSALNGA
jgi:hypothetical protein